MVVFTSTSVKYWNTSDFEVEYNKTVYVKLFNRSDIGIDLRPFK